MIDLSEYKKWADKTFGENNYIIEVRNGEICIDAWNPKAKCIGLVEDDIRPITSEVEKYVKVYHRRHSKFFRGASSSLCF